MPSKVRTPRATSTILTRRHACALYREKVRNLEALNEKARERMALSTPACARASRRYREQNARELAFKQRERRDIEYIKKYGEEALANCNRTRQERRESARAAVELRTWEEAWRDEREKSAAGRLYDPSLNGLTRAANRVVARRRHVLITRAAAAKLRYRNIIQVKHEFQQLLSAIISVNASTAGVV
ncbi:hypothetical protein GGX14DRAFT_402453 [Mycena pura]|uniref:Uncharacterized protein n=1 Tax=Mycena pura TaxID=153505 RepID=A0AAD6UY10_9AGAR|nr:hypothetical protein GGX14DRAFT_402453 [Mycena pura]